MLPRRQGSILSRVLARRGYTYEIITLTPDIEQALAAEARKLGPTPEQLALDSLRAGFLCPESERVPTAEPGTLADFLCRHVGVLHSSEYVPGGARLSDS
jgi:hypothetical protein